MSAPDKPYSNREKTIPITWINWDLLDTMTIQFYPVKFAEDWGPIKADSEFEAVTINYGSGMLECYTRGSDKPLFAVRFKLTPTRTR